MNFEEQQTPISDHFLDCFDGSISYLPFSLDNLGDSADVNDDSWRIQSEDLHHELINNIFNFCNNPVASDSLPPSSSSTKRKTPDDSPSKNHQKVQNDRTNGTKHGDSAGRKSGRTKKATAKPRGNNCDHSNNNKETWAGQLLNPCAAAISTGNLTRVQHLLCVLHELASLTGDANCRLAAHGLTALTHHPSSSGEAINYTSMNPGFFRESLIKFNDINPWFTIPDNMANSSILQILSTQKPSSNLHILDIGVSHGVQWPILLEALTRQPNGPPPLVRLTVIMPAIDNNQTTDAPFVNGPPGYDFTSKLLSYATHININLQITRLENHPLQNLNANVINSSPDDTLIICAQFRLHNLSHNPDERTEFMRVLRSLEPKGVILSENNMDCACNNCGDFATAFSRRLEYLWIFLHSTGTAFKGHESEERRMMEGEAAKALTDLGEMNERKEKWCERMRSVGFIGEVFGENVMDGARSLLKKYDNKWEMKVDESDRCVGLQWTGQPVSFCSLWKIDTKRNAC